MSEEANKIRVTVTRTEPKILRVDLLDEGREGIKVKYDQLMIRNTIATQNNNSETSKRPVQLEVRTLFSDLKKHLLTLAGYHWGSVTALDMLMENCKVTYFMRDDKLGKFQLGGTMKIKGKYVIAVNTPYIQDEHYDEAADVRACISLLIQEVKLFMSGAKGADSRQVTVDYLRSKKDIVNAEEEFDRMSPEEQKQFMDEAYEKFGMNNISLENEEENDAPFVAAAVEVAKTGSEREPVDNKATEEKPTEEKQPQKAKKVAAKKSTEEVAAPVLAKEQNLEEDLNFELLSEE